MAGEKTSETYGKTYEYTPEECWGTGENPTPDGLWEFSCYDPSENEYVLMKWMETQACFYSPLHDHRASPQWYCQYREGGLGMHPGRATHAVKSFRCPHGGEVDVFFSLGRNAPYQRKWNRSWKSWQTPCSARLYLNDIPLCDEVVMETTDPVLLNVTCSVRPGDKIRLHIDPMGDHVCDGVVLYRQRISYRNVTENSRNDRCESL